MYIHVVAWNVLGDRSEDTKKLSVSTRSLYPSDNLRETSKTQTIVDLEWDRSPAFEGMTIEYEIYEIAQGDGSKLVGKTEAQQFTVIDLDHTFSIVSRDNRQHSAVFSDDPQNSSTMSDLSETETEKPRQIISPLR